MFLRSVTHLVRRPDCLSGERDSISLRSASFLDKQGVAQPGESACLGRRRPLVRIQPP
jgi:hypothetical protein